VCFYTYVFLLILNLIMGADIFEVFHRSLYFRIGYNTASINSADLNLGHAFSMVSLFIAETILIKMR